jgi:hypothetical protein
MIHCHTLYRLVRQRALPTLPNARWLANRKPLQIRRLPETHLAHYLRSRDTRDWKLSRIQSLNGTCEHFGEGKRDHGWLVG